MTGDSFARHTTPRAQPGPVADAVAGRQVEARMQGASARHPPPPTAHPTSTRIDGAFCVFVNIAVRTHPEGAHTALHHPCHISCHTPIWHASGTAPQGTMAATPA